MLRAAGSICLQLQIMHGSPRDRSGDKRLFSSLLSWWRISCARDMLLGVVLASTPVNTQAIYHLRRVS